MKNKKIQASIRAKLARNKTKALAKEKATK
jgi:hypothetical protein